MMHIESAFLVWKDLKEIFDKISGPRTYKLHMKIVMFQQGFDSISTFFFSRLNVIWAEYDVACAFPHIEGEDFKKHI